ncbi:MAG TPA: hypothetical protein PLJ21_10900 [Pseudobdellovibrionaceae bacterium]|nr:hypothetical protein [Pseudobdellovibrionaceae bacterium]
MCFQKHIIDFNDSRIGGAVRCDITQEVESSFDSSIFKATGFEAINGVNGIYQSTPSCKIFCTQPFSVPEDLKQTDFTVMGVFKVRFTVQKKNSDEAPVNIYSQETITVGVNVD